MGSKSQAPQCLKQQSQHFLGFMVFAFTMPAGILFASCSAAAVPAEGSGDSGFITLLDPADGNLSSIIYYPHASCGGGVGCCPPITAPASLGCWTLPVHRDPSSSSGDLQSSSAEGAPNPCWERRTEMLCPRWGAAPKSSWAQLQPKSQARQEQLGPASGMLRRGSDLLQGPRMLKGGECSSLA